MNDKTNLIVMLSKTETSFLVDGNKVIIHTSTDNDKTTFTFDTIGNLIKVSCNH